MAPQLSHQIAEQVDNAAPLYHRLVIVVGPPRSGKTAALRELNADRGWPIVNINLALSERLLELSTRQRALKAGRIVEDIVQDHSTETIMLDNIEMLFHPDLQQDPLRLLKRLSRHRTVVAAWRGSLAGQSLIYGAPGHPEYRRYDNPDALVVAALGTQSVIGAPAAAQEQAG